MRVTLQNMRQKFIGLFTSDAPSKGGDDQKLVFGDEAREFGGDFLEDDCVRGEGWINQDLVDGRYTRKEQNGNIEKLQLRRMLATYRSTMSTKAVSIKTEKKADHHGHNKGQPILPEVAQVIIDAKSGKRYFRGRLLGKGGFARCYEVTDMQTDRKLACKAISKARIAKPHQQQKIANEVELHRNLNGHFVVGFHAYFEDSENVYMLLELCSRKSMVQLLKQRRTLTEPEVRYFMQQAVEGVRYLHRERIIHRDIKLGNLFINNDMEIRIGDFGLAVRAGPDGKKETSVCGTPNYIAPEVLSKAGHSYEVDTWALGCVMYTLLVGRPPFETSCLKDTYMRIRNNEYAIPSRVSRPASKLIQKLLSERPEDRPSLDTILSDEFFTRGYFPKSLPSICCVAPPKFTSSKNRTSHSHRRYVQLHQSRGSSVSATTADEHSNVSTMKEALDRISLKDNFNMQQKDDLGESGIDSQGSHADEDEDQDVSSGVGEESSCDYHNPQTLCTRLSSCLNAMPDPNSTGKSDPISTGTSDSEDDHNTTGYESRTSSCPYSTGSNHLWITKWVDYSNKYGFGAQLSNGCIVIRYNDGTTLAVDAQKRRLQYFDEDRNIFRFSVNNIPEDLSRKVTLLNYFSNYMDKHLLKGGDLEDGGAERETFSDISIIDIWFRTDKAMVMYLSDGTLQVNFLADHTKIILNPEESNDIVTFINQNRESYVTSLSEISKRGCKESINERLQYCLMVLHKLTEMYLEDMS